MVKLKSGKSYSTLLKATHKSFSDSFRSRPMSLAYDVGKDDLPSINSHVATDHATDVARSIY